MTVRTALSGTPTSVIPAKAGIHWPRPNANVAIGRHRPLPERGGRHCAHVEDEAVGGGAVHPIVLVGRVESGHRPEDGLAQPRLRVLGEREISGRCPRPGATGSRSRGYRWRRSCRLRTRVPRASSHSSHLTGSSAIRARCYAIPEFGQVSRASFRFPKFSVHSATRFRELCPEAAGRRQPHLRCATTPQNTRLRRYSQRSRPTWCFRRSLWFVTDTQSS